MAELNVERKQKTVWGWVVAVIIALLIIWALFVFLGDDDVGDVTLVPTQSMSTPAQPQPVHLIAATPFITDSITDSMST